MLVARKVKDALVERDSELSRNVQQILDKFADVMLDEPPKGLLPSEDILHAIDLVPRSSNLPYNRMKQIELIEIR